MASLESVQVLTHQFLHFSDAGSTHSRGYHEPVTQPKPSVCYPASQNSKANHEHRDYGEDYGEGQKNPLIWVDDGEEEGHGDRCFDRNHCRLSAQLEQWFQSRLQHWHM